MSARFEAAIQEWYSKRSDSLDALDLALPKPKLLQLGPTVLPCFGTHQSHSLNSTKPIINSLVDLSLANLYNLSAFHDQANLAARVEIKHFHTLLEGVSRIEQSLEAVEGKVHRLEQEVGALKSGYLSHQPLTKGQVKALVLEIAKQPKLIEEEALKLTEELRQQIADVRALVERIHSAI
ncbi:hypothetical protein QKM20_gp1 [Epiphyllum badnavirus 1]|uniref:Uncharacterized protein n=1 Tax=Epiphyllum badnavirus 1 TaxID=2518008 RepID=A0A411HE67_9VIRU|nr:hypothetical protein QKM20_gp1 [Epiphyllum badnavirus 1]QBB68758.1 hypothetical protein [Epiphyllum badnavirus 1]